MIIKKYGILLRTVKIKDAEFILSLRSNDKLGMFISPTENDIKKQRQWIKLYKKREKAQEELYFITVDSSGKKYGVNRIYNFDQNSFESGSWLFSPESPIGMSILSDLVGRDFGFEELGLSFCHFNVRKKNITVVNYHLKFNPIIVKEDEVNYYFRLDSENYKRQRDNLLRMFYKREN
jgi:hypothetical protein